MTDSAETPVSAPEGDPEAPWGRRADGEPKKGPGGRPAGKRGTFRKRATSRPKGAAAPSRATRPNTPRAKPADYTETAQGLVQLFAAGLGLAPVKRGAPLAEALQLDALTLHMRAAEAAELVNESARELPWLGAALDKWNQYTPWAKPAMFLGGLLAQFAVNHRVASVAQTQAFGTVSREELAMMAVAMAPEGPAAAPPPEFSPSEPPPVEPEDTGANGHQADPPSFTTFATAFPTS